MFDVLLFERNETSVGVMGCACSNYVLAKPKFQIPPIEQRRYRKSKLFCTVRIDSVRPRNSLEVVYIYFNSVFLAGTI